MIALKLRMGRQKHRDFLLWLDEFRIEHLRDIYMLVVAEKGTCIGINQAVRLNAKAHNPFMGDHYNADDATIYVQYIESNNEYIWEMNEKMSTYRFEREKKVEYFMPRKTD